MTQAKRTRVVTDEEYRQAWEDPDNHAMIQSFVWKYRYSIPDMDDRLSAGHYALLKALRGHDDSFGQKFTSSLYLMLGFEFNRAAHRYRVRRERMPAEYRPLEEVTEAGQPLDNERLLAEREYLREQIRHLPRDQREVIVLYYLEGRSLDEVCRTRGMSRDSGKKVLGRGLQRLREVCLARPWEGVTEEDY